VVDYDESVQAPAVNTTPYSSPLHSLGSTVIVLTNPDPDIRKLEATLRGVVEHNGVFVRVSAPLMNEEGVRSVIGHVESVVNRITSMSKFDDRQVYNLVMSFSEALRIDLMLNRVLYDITNPSARYRIAFEAKMTAYASLQKAHEQGERLFLKSSHQEVTSRVDSQKKGGSLFSKIVGWGGGSG
jgi:hypothetical protein